ncbi:MAG TPA: hypothetical protein V6D29_02800, partial [Leptolyngbyaceae cyanobacterium]
QQELRLERKFSLAEVIGREGGDFMKGESPVPPLVQAIAQLNLFISQNLSDSAGALQAVLQTWIKAEDTQISRHLNAPLMALQVMIENILNSPETLYELVRQADVRWGQIFDERPHFQQPGEAPHPDDAYTHESVRATLIDFLEAVKQQQRDSNACETLAKAVEAPKRRWFQVIWHRLRR